MGIKQVRNLKLGYVPLSSDFTATGDRRRFAYWTKHNSINPQIADFRNCDLVVLTSFFSFDALSQIPSRIPIIFDLPDQYVEEDNIFKDYLRLLGRNPSLKGFLGIKKFSSLILDILQSRGEVVCSSPEQVNWYRARGIKATPILDFHEEIPFVRRISQFRLHESFSIFWEGQSNNLSSLKSILSKKMQFKDKITFNLVTDVDKYSFGNKYIKDSSLRYVGKMHNNSSLAFKLFPWSLENLRKVALNSSISIIPINNKSKIAMMKPENRTLISWKLGLPTLVSPSPSHLRVQNHIKAPYVVYDENWLEALNIFFKDPSSLEDQIYRGREYIKEFHTREILMRKWNEVITGAIK